MSCSLAQGPPVSIADHPGEELAWGVIDFIHYGGGRSIGLLATPAQSFFGTGMCLLRGYS